MRLFVVFCLWCLLCLTVPAAQADDVSIGLVASFPDGFVYHHCFRVPADEDLRDIIERSGLDPTWSLPQGLMGADLCRLHDVGCPRTVCACKQGAWHLFYAEENATSWKTLPVAIDIKGVCWQRDGETVNRRYCPRDGDVVGLAFGSDNVSPSFIYFDDICPEASDTPSKKSFDIHTDPSAPQLGGIVTVTVRDDDTLAPVDDARIIIRPHLRSIHHPNHVVRTDERGRASFHLSQATDYDIDVYRHGYEPYSLSLTVHERLPATSTTVPVIAPSLHHAVVLETPPAPSETPRQHSGLNDDYVYPAITGAVIGSPARRPPTAPPVQQDVDSFASFLLRFALLSFLLTVLVLIARSRRPATYPDYRATVIDTSP